MTFVQEKKKIGIFIYPEMELQDFAGPTDVFVKANRFSEDQYEILLFSEDGAEIETEQRTVSITPQYSFETLPQVDLVLIPGAPNETVMNLFSKARIKEFLVSRKEQGSTMVSVCTGAYFLSSAGLLDKHKFTTHYLAATALQKLTPNGELVINVRFVDSGEILTSSGITCGIDLALYLVRKYSGEEIQKKVADLMQYKYKQEEKWPDLV
jgi:transcriptional regulator GlxA family with amidase domain